MARDSILINEPVDSQVKWAALYRFPHCDFGESRRRETPKQSAMAFNSTFKKMLIQSLNRTEPASGERKAHAF